MHVSILYGAFEVRHKIMCYHLIDWNKWTFDVWKESVQKCVCAARNREYDPVQEEETRYELQLMYCIVFYCIYTFI